MDAVHPPLPGFLKRARQAASYTVRGILPSTWMSPLQPLPPFEPASSARQWDYPVGYNLFYTPRGRERYDFADLRAVARKSELVRLAIPRRVYTQSHIEYVVEIILDVWSRREKIPGYELVHQAPFLRHFTARLKPLAT